MQQNFNREEERILDQIDYLVGNSQSIKDLPLLPTQLPFNDPILNFLQDLSHELMSDPKAKQYPEIVTLGFWIRKASLNLLKKRFLPHDQNIHLGIGVVFHIAPSNVPVNFAYSLITGLLLGNANIVRVPSKPFLQVEIIGKAINKLLMQHEAVRPYIILVRYEKLKEINDLLSSLADVRVIWGGDATIADLRRSPLPPRSTEITFADRYSLAIIDTDVYLSEGDFKRVAQNFYNDTYLSDQNACTSPKLVVWVGSKKEEAKQIFWEHLHELVKEKYVFQPIMGVNKLTTAELLATQFNNIKIIKTKDNLLSRVQLFKVTAELIDFKENSGFFLEYDCDDLMHLKDLCSDRRVQTIGFLGDQKILRSLLLSGVKGIDRVVPLGKTMDFDLIWDGYNLVERLTRTINVPI